MLLFGYILLVALHSCMWQLPPHIQKYCCLENDKIRMFYDYWVGMKFIKLHSA